MIEVRYYENRRACYAGDTLVLEARLVSETGNTWDITTMIPGHSWAITPGQGEDPDKDELVLKAAEVILLVLEQRATLIRKCQEELAAANDLHTQAKELALIAMLHDE